MVIAGMPKNGWDHMPKWVNADKPHLWKSDITASVDQFNQWFMRFAPDAFRSTRVNTSADVGQPMTCAISAW